MLIPVQLLGAMQLSMASIILAPIVIRFERVKTKERSLALFCLFGYLHAMLLTHLSMSRFSNIIQARTRFTGGGI